MSCVKIREGTPLVGLEPSCVAVFRDEMCDMLPFNEDARRLSEQTYTLAEFLVKKADHFKMPSLKRKAIIHGHCHQKAIMKMSSEENMFEDMEMDAVKAGETMLLPAVREADKKLLLSLMDLVAVSK